MYAIRESKVKVNGEMVPTFCRSVQEENVSMLVADAGTRLYPVGRLDLNSEGLLIMTDDGTFANHLMHPSNSILKTYEVRVEGKDINTALNILRGPIEIEGTYVQAKAAELKASSGKKASLLITIGEGKNREVRKMCAAAGLKVTELKRIREGILDLGDLESGRWRYLTTDEIESFSREDA